MGLIEKCVNFLNININGEEHTLKKELLIINFEKLKKRSYLITPYRLSHLVSRNFKQIASRVARYVC